MATGTSRADGGATSVDPVHDDDANASAESGPTFKILLVEDSPGDARLAIEMLHQASAARFDLARATRLEEALRRIRRGGIDLVLLDVLLPDSMGIDTLRRLREHAPEVPVIVLTGLADEAIGEAFMDEGADEVILKGQFDAASLERTVLRVLRRRARQARAEPDEPWRMTRQGLRQMYDALPDGIVVLDEEGTVRFANAEASIEYGYEDGDVAGMLLGHFDDSTSSWRSVATEQGGRSIQAEGRRVVLEGHEAILVVLRRPPTRP